MGLTKVNALNGIFTLFIVLLVIWLRMAVHYLGQYFILKLMDAPVISVKLVWYKVNIEYAFWKIQ